MKTPVNLLCLASLAAILVAACGVKSGPDAEAALADGDEESTEGYGYTGIDDPADESPATDGAEVTGRKTAAAGAAQKRNAGARHDPVGADAYGNFQRVQLMDSSGFGAPMVAGTAEIPEGWVTDGGVFWERSQDCVTNHLRMKWIAASPDGADSFELMPGANWQVLGTDIQMNPCPPMAIQSARELLQAVARRYPGVQELEYRDRSDLLKAPPEAANPNMRVRVDAGQLFISYMRGGQQVFELLTTAVTFSELQGNIVGGTPSVYAQRAIGGRKLDPALGDRIMKSMKPDPQWTAIAQKTMMAAIQRVSDMQRQGIMRWHAQRMAEINARGMADRAAIRAQTNREVAAIYSATWQNGMATDERIQRRTLESIGGYNTYADPASGGTVRGSIHYDRVIRNADGTYFSTNDPYLNPAGSQELQRIP